MIIDNLTLVGLIGVISITLFLLFSEIRRKKRRLSSSNVKLENSA